MRSSMADTDTADGDGPEPVADAGAHFTVVDDRASDEAVACSGGQAAQSSEV